MSSIRIGVSDLGTESQLHTKRASRPRPPITAKKPSLPKKPSLGTKPPFQHINNQNGTISNTCDVLPENNLPVTENKLPVTENDLPVSSLSETTTTAPSNTTTNKTEKPPKPNHPPPPLPKISPHGSPIRPPPTAHKPSIDIVSTSKPASNNTSPVGDTVDANAQDTANNYASDQHADIPSVHTDNTALDIPKSEEIRPPHKTPPLIPKNPPKGNLITNLSSKESPPGRDCPTHIPKVSQYSGGKSQPTSKDSSPARDAEGRKCRTPPPLPKEPPRSKLGSKYMSGQSSTGSDRSMKSDSKECSPVNSYVDSDLKSSSSSTEVTESTELSLSSSVVKIDDKCQEKDILDDSHPETFTTGAYISSSINGPNENIPDSSKSLVESPDLPLKQSDIDTHLDKVCDNLTVESDKPVTSEDFKFSTLKSRFLNCEKQNVQVPVKPKPRKSDRVKSVQDHKHNSDVNSSKDMLEDKATSESSSQSKSKAKWYVDEDSTSNTVNKAEKNWSSGDKKSSVFKIQFSKESADEDCVKISKSASSDASGRTEERPESGSKDACDREHCAVSDDLHDAEAATKMQKPTDRSPQVKETLAVEAQDNTSEGSGNIPTPVPRKTVPVPKPRPVPRKRLSINRLSGTEETFNTGNESPSPLSKAQSEESVFKSDNELKLAPKGEGSVDDVQVVLDENASESVPEVTDKVSDSTQVKVERKQNDSPLKVKSLVKTRVVYNDKGEEKQYRVIDKSIVANCDKTAKEAKVSLRSKKELNDNLRLSYPPEVTNDRRSGEDQSERFAADDLPNVNEGAERSSLSDIDKNKTDNNDSPKSNDSFDDLLGDTEMLKPSSLLSEIEEILSRSFKTSSLTRSGSSPEKKVAPFFNLQHGRQERSRSVDTNPEDMPVRPPRPKKEQKKLRSQSQVLYDSCGSDTESLPDMSKGRDTTQATNKSITEKSLTLGPAKPHPPKPKRHKLLKVQRSQSDVSAMKLISDTKEQNPASHQQHRRQVSDAGPYNMEEACPSGSPGQPVSWRKSRPSRRAPDPPSISPYKTATPSPVVDINYVVPLDSRVRSMNLSGAPSKPRRSESDQIPIEYFKDKDTCGSFYSSINGDESRDSTDDEHDYHEISEEITNSQQNITSEASPKSSNSMSRPRPSARSRPLRTPPKLPPRNSNASNSFETSSISSTGQELDSGLTGGVSSMEDVSVSSGFEAEGIGMSKDVASPAGFKGFSKQMQYPSTSSPYVKGQSCSEKDVDRSSQGLNLSVSSGSDSYINQRPVSGTSLQYDSGSSGPVPGHLSSSDSEDDVEKTNQKKDAKCKRIAEEVMSSERVFVDVLVLLNVDFRHHVSLATEAAGRPVIPTEVLNRILDYLPQLQNFNENLLSDLEERLKKWNEKKGIADIFVKKGPFLKLYSMYIRDFETMTATFDDACKKYPAFQAAVKEFETSERCACLALKHYMLKPIQRIPQYRLLLQDYLKHLPENSPEMKDMKTALAIVSEVAHHANENMRHSDYVQKMLEIQRSLIGQFEVIKPGRLFLKEGELLKLSRKDEQPRYFFLFNDVLLYTTPVATGYRLNNVLPLAGMKVSVSAQDEYKMEFSIISVQRSFTLHGNTLEERDDWVTALNSAIEENALKRNTFEAVRAGAQFRDDTLQASWEIFKVLLDKDFVVGHKAPLWIPDARVTMCMLCTGEFTVTWRRHHCRACGRVVCGNCSDCKAPLRYLKYKPSRVCDECYKTLKEEAEKEGGKERDVDTGSAGEPEESLSLHSITNNLMERFVKIRRSGRVEKKSRPDRLKAVRANDEEASMSGYLHRMYKGKKWKRQWFLIKDKVLYTFKATQDTAAADSMVLLGYEVSRFSEYFEGIEPELLFQLSHQNTEPIVFRTDSATATEKWVQSMREAIVA